MQAVKDTYQQHPLVVSSTKGNVGHCEAASALVGIIKTVLCLEHQQIPAQMHLSALNPSINLTNTNIIIPKKVLPWPKPSSDPNCKPRAAINTFGAGGTNGHAVLESSAHRRRVAPATERPWLFRVSAADETSLRSLTRSYAEYVEKRGPNLRDLAHTLLAHRSSFRFSHFFVASTYGSLLAQLRSDSAVVSKISNVRRRLLLVFTSQGAQWQVLCATHGVKLIWHLGPGWAVHYLVKVLYSGQRSLNVTACSKNFLTHRLGRFSMSFPRPEINLISSKLSTRSHCAPPYK